MDLSNHTMHDLFDQLGLPSDETSVQKFIARHRPLPQGQQLADAPFWTPAQAQFLREQLSGDADWAEVVDQLNVSLHA
ncbi:DUF2789 domain-containing protein [Pseudorhodoferax sp. Leaf267]|uniref:DUF2789 domain-containing protein n=1 Tax=Pseudorhodoferax sp. Leaf267 TaxID=1736316 RepID=UPI0006F53010|nr:DUF2789 domain-containing protein [Pseudorhodoferax sp. Leaf267]KQP21735.1 hypothetical protein ASF43_25880 [Pseudorhodoferax sp. Leaf267]